MNQHQKVPLQEVFLPRPVNPTRDRPTVVRTAILPATPAPVTEPFIRRIWPLATIVFGLALTAVWMSLLGYLLGYALVTLIGMAI
jgi:hypothetical protein